MPIPVDSNEEPKWPENSSWFYRSNGRQYGPVSLADLRAAAVLGFLGPCDFVRPQEKREWLCAASIADVVGIPLTTRTKGRQK